MAGVPVYPRQGRNGGWQLVGGARTDLSGLTSTESRALFLVAGPASTATPPVKAALRKLLRAIPEPFRESAEAAAAAITSTRRAGVVPAVAVRRRSTSTRCSRRSSRAGRSGSATSPATARRRLV